MNDHIAFGTIIVTFAWGSYWRLKCQSIEKHQITDDMVDQVESAVGMGAPAWDMVDPKEIIAESFNCVLGEHLGRSGLVKSTPDAEP